MATIARSTDLGTAVTERERRTDPTGSPAPSAGGLFAEVGMLSPIEMASMGLSLIPFPFQFGSPIQNDCFWCN